MTIRSPSIAHVAPAQGAGGASVQGPGGQTGVDHKGRIVSQAHNPHLATVSAAHKLTRTMASWRGTLQTPLASMPRAEIIRRAVVSGTPLKGVLRAARMMAQGKGGGARLSSAERYSGARFLASCLEEDSTDPADVIAFVATGHNAAELADLLQKSNSEEMWELLKDMLDNQDVLPKTQEALFEALVKVRFDTKKLFDILARAQGISRELQRESLRAVVDDLLAELELGPESALDVAKFHSAITALAQPDPEQFQETYVKAREVDTWQGMFQLVIGDSEESNAEYVRHMLETQGLALGEEMMNVRRSTDKTRLLAALRAVQRAHKCWTLYKSVEALHAQMKRMYPPENPVWQEDIPA
jgi:hypothetical protein